MNEEDVKIIVYIWREKFEGQWQTLFVSDELTMSLRFREFNICTIVTELRKGLF